MAKRSHLIAGVLPFVLLLAHFALCLLLTWRILARSGDPGLLVLGKGDVMRIAQVRPGGPASTLVPGDELLSLDGRGVTASHEVVQFFQSRSPGPYRMVLRRDGRLLSLVLSTIPHGWTWWTFSLLSRLFIQGLFLLAGVSVFVLKPNDRQALLLALLFACFAGALSVPVPLTALSSPTLALVIAAETLGILFWPIFLHFFLVFPETSPVLRRFPRLEWLLYVPGLGIALLVAASFWVWMAMGPAVVVAWFEGSSTLKWALHFALFNYAVAGLLSLVLNYRQAARASRRRLRVIVAGSLAGFLPPVLAGVLFLLVDPWKFPLWFLRGLSALILLSLPLVPLSFAYAIVRHQVIPLRLIVRRGVRYLLVSRGFLLVEAAVVAAVLAFLLTGSRAEVLDRMGGRADIAATVLAAGAVLGGLTALHRRIMPAIDRRFFRDAYDGQRVLAEVGQSARTAGTVEDVVEHAVTVVQGALHAESVAVYLRKEGGTDYGCVVSVERGVVWRPAAGKATSPTALTAGSRIIERLSQSPSPVAGESGEVYLPIVTKGELLGILALGPRLGDLPYSREDKEVLSAVAWQVAFAVENSRLVRRMAEEERLRREVEIASTVQRRLFPDRPPQLPGLDLAGLCQPAQGVGGDYYDFLTLSPGRLGIAVADVAGKGLSAALLMSIVQASLRSQAGSGDGSLTELVASMNRLLYRSTERNAFATFFYALFDEQTRRLRYVNAGHNPPMLIRGRPGAAAGFRPATANARPLGGYLGAAARPLGAEAAVAFAPEEVSSLVLLRAGGLVIGAVDSSTYEEETLQLDPGDVLVAYTDGVTEAFNAAWEEFGEERLQEAVVAAQHLPAQELAEAVVLRVHEWRGDAPQHDDITLVVAKVR